jgi:hypothetical protein
MDGVSDNAKGGYRRVEVLTGLGRRRAPAAPARRSASRIEVRLAGAELRFASGTDAALLTMVPRAIRASAP